MSEIEQRLLMLIDDEPAQCRLITALAAREGWRTLVVRDSETAIATLGTRQGMQLNAIVLDQWVPGDDACALIAELKSRRPALPILMLTTSSSPLLAVEAMRAGATDYLIKPVAPDRLRHIGKGGGSLLRGGQSGPVGDGLRDIPTAIVRGRPRGCGRETRRDD